MLFSRAKLFFSVGSIFCFIALIVGRLVQLQLVRGKEYSNFSDSYTIKEIPLPAPRGIIYDRKGRILAKTRPSFNLILHVQRVQNLDRLLAELAEILSVSPESLNKILGNSKNLPRFQPILLASHLKEDQISRFLMRKSLETADKNQKSDFNALELRIDALREYEDGALLGHVLGFIREVSEEHLFEMQRKYPNRYAMGDQVGIQGIERRFDLELRGIKGRKEVIVDALGHEMLEDKLGLKKELSHTPAESGNNLYLTLDLDLQKASDQALGKRNGAVVVLDAHTGEVLAMASHPSYDPDRLVTNFSKEYWISINKDENKVLLNRSIQGAYPPGSTFKIITGIAALAEGILRPSDTISCPGYYQHGDRRFGCWLGKGHGPVNFYRALVESCDVYFYKVGEKLGVDRISHYAHLLGLGEKTGIDLDFERSGLVPSSEWKKRVRKEEWRASETLSVAIGQGYNLVTPLQNALMIARVANGGFAIRPHLVKEIESADGTRRSIEKDPPEKIEFGKNPKILWDSVHNALKGVVQSPSGTAHRSQLPKVEFAGKTGTAQVVNYDKFGRKATSRKTEDHAWFVAYAPADKPEIAIAVIVEHGGHGGAAAAPVARSVIKRYLELYKGYDGKSAEEKSKESTKRLPIQGD